ncbi:MAG: hypothetical protein Q9196_006482, partial [Gyalolechia fulgens]
MGGLVSGRRIAVAQPPRTCEERFESTRFSEELKVCLIYTDASKVLRGNRPVYAKGFHKLSQTTYGLILKLQQDALPTEQHQHK